MEEVYSLFLSLGFILADQEYLAGWSWSIVDLATDPGANQKCRDSLKFLWEPSQYCPNVLRSQDITSGTRCLHYAT